MLAMTVGYLVYKNDRSRAQHAKGPEIKLGPVLKNTDPMEKHICVMADEFHMSLQSQAPCLYKPGLLDVLSKHNALFHML